MTFHKQWNGRRAAVETKSNRNFNEKSAQRDANTARALAVDIGHRPPATNKQTNTQTDRTDYNTLRRS